MDSATAPHDLITQVRERVRDLESLKPGERDVCAVDLIDEMESLKNAAAAAQARASHLLKETRVAERAHLPGPMRDRGVATEVALARRESPHRGSIHLGLAGVLVRELPHTLAAMEAGRCSEWRAIQIAQGTACLSLEDRQEIDAELDRSCRTPDCDAPIRHRDHVVPVARGGPTSASNGQGLCEGCNQAKEAEDFRTWVVDAELHDLVLETPSGHRYRCVLPGLPPPQEHSFVARFEENLNRLLRRSA